ncbi:MAG: hypothetical protein IBX40_10980 [Methanosarcinales archaeon]|nr:hypothetical protein [Methanosarcinales archaeon]
MALHSSLFMPLSSSTISCFSGTSPPSSHSGPPIPTVRESLDKEVVPGSAATTVKILL